MVRADNCPECDYILDVLYENNFEFYLCPNCGIYWAICPNCGQIVDMDEYWNHEQGVCDDCQNENGRGV